MLGTKDEIEDKILEFVKGYVLERHMTPRYKEIAKAVGFKSVGSVYKYVKDLEAKGLLEANGMRGTNLANWEDASPAEIPLVGAIACGTPIYADENVEAYLNIDRMLLGKGEFFALRAKGDSMVGAGIEDGDIVVCCKQETAEQGEIVAALIDDEATLKRYYIDVSRHKVILKPENSSYKPMEFDNVQIQGKAVKIIKDVR